MNFEIQSSIFKIPDFSVRHSIFKIAAEPLNSVIRNVERTRCMLTLYFAGEAVSYIIAVKKTRHRSLAIRSQYKPGHRALWIVNRANHDSRTTMSQHVYRSKYEKDIEQITYRISRFHSVRR